MKNLIKATICGLLLLQPLYSQTEPDPFQGKYNLGSSSEIALFWHYDQFSDSTVKFQVVDYYGNSGQYFLDSSSKGYYTGNLGTGYNNGFSDFYFDAITGDLNGDGYDNVIAAWESSNNSINIVIAQVDKNNLNWDDENVLILNNVLFNNPDNAEANRFRLIKGFFDKDPQPEFVLAYWNTTGNIEIKIYDVDPNSLTPVERASISDEYLDPSLDNSGLYDIAAGDFDGDLMDEIILSAYSQQSQTNWAIYAKAYDYVEDNGSYSLVPKVKKDDFYTSNDFWSSAYKVNNIAIAAGDFKNNTLDELIVDFVVTNNSSEARNYILPGSINLTMDTLSVDKSKALEMYQVNGSSIINIGVITADINNDGRDEILIDGDGRIRIYTIDDDHNLTNEAEANGVSYSDSPRRMMLADLDASTSDSVWNPEIIFTTTSYIQPGSGQQSYSTLNVEVFSPVVSPSGDIISIQDRAFIRVDSIPGGSNYYWAVTAGDFDGGGISLGVPNYYHATDIVQPLVILNAPPTHFDVINGISYDINKSYNGQVSDFYSRYFTQSESEINVISEIHSDWVVGGSASGGFTIPIVEVGVKAKIESEYGEGFSKQESSKETYRVSQNITATNDDYLYATIVNYDIWEYPVIANDTIQGYTLVFSPGLKTRSWFPSKSPQALEYLPDHETGNILSYNQIASPGENSALDISIKWNTSDEFTLGANSTFNWTLENENQTQTTVTTEKDWSIGASVEFDIPFKLIPDLEFHGNYSNGSVSTRKNTVTFTQGLEVNLSSIDLGIGETYYSVIPYAYWSKSGALVLDYAVNPGAAPPNVPETWFQQNYSDASDPALILPWRLDPEKGYSIPEDKRYQTKELIFNPDNPEPGETINIKTRIHNYSMLNTPGPVSARFYLGDPDNGGTLIESTNGQTIFSTDDFIGARKSKVISFDWTLPANTPYFPRIYVVLDPDNTINEIHENNNKGWKVLNFSDGTTAVDNDGEVINSFELSQNYPNPFNPTTIIRYEIPQTSKVEMKIFDVLGREVETLVNDIKLPGQYEVNFNGVNLASGVYFYRIEAGDFVLTKKMILLR